MYVRVLNIAHNQYRLDCLFGGLLSLKAQIFEIDVRHMVSGQRKIAASAVQLLSWVIRRKTLNWPHIPLFHLAGRV